MIRQSRPDVLDLASTARTRSRSQSMNSDIHSAPGSAMSASASPIQGVSPQPAYIAASAATQIVTSDHESFFQTLHAEGIVTQGPHTLQVTPEALRLVNQFLDYLLWSIISVGKSTLLRSLRPAVTEVLKVRLAREAISCAEAELEEYLGDADEDELDDATWVGDEFDVERAWKRARLRCMIYSSLGDLEEDDEDAYSDSGYPGHADQNSQRATVSPAVAIFLTSILEFIGEQTLLVAGQATIARFSQARIAAAAEEGSNGNYEAVERPVVEELDAEKVALNPVLGRMWRQWKKVIRAPGSIQTASRQASFRRESRRGSAASAMIQASMHSDEVGNGEFDEVSNDGNERLSSISEADKIGNSDSNSLSGNLLKANLKRLASNEKLSSLAPPPLTPIPETPRTADQVESRYSEHESLRDEDLYEIPDFPRPNSMINLPSNSGHFVFPFSASNVKAVETPTIYTAEESPERPGLRRLRSTSLPLPGSFPFTPEEVDLESLPWPVTKNEEDMLTPMPNGTPFFINADDQIPDTQSQADTDAGTNVTDFDDDGNMSIVESLVSIHDGEIEHTYQRAHSVRIISTSSPPGLFNIPERKSDSTVHSLPETKPDNVVIEEREITTPSESGTDRRDSHAPEEIGIARTSDLFIPPVSVSSAVQISISPHPNYEQPSIDSQEVRRPSADSTAESTHSIKDLVKERRRRSRYFVPAPVPTEPDFFPEHHTEEEIEEHYKRQQNNAESSTWTEAGAQALTVPSRGSPRSELTDPDEISPEFEEDQIPAKRETVKVSKSLRATSPLVPALSPGLSQTSRSVASESSDSLTPRSMSSNSLGNERRYPASFDLPRTTNFFPTVDNTTPTSGPGERAGLRVWTPPATPDGAKTTHRGKRSTSFKEHRGHHASNSISSQTSQKLKTLIGKTPDYRSASRHESDNDSSYSETHAGLVAKIDEKERSFEQLINSGATLQYTLTPDTLKKMDLEAPSIPFTDRPRKGSTDSNKSKSGSDKYVPMAPLNTSVPRRSASIKSRPLTTIAAEDETQPMIPSSSHSPTTPRLGSPISPISPGNVNVFPPRTTSTPSSVAAAAQRSLQQIDTTIAKPMSTPTIHTPLSPIRSPVASTQSPINQTRLRSPGFPVRSTSAADEIRPLRSSASKHKLIAREPHSASADSTMALIEFFKNTPPPLNESPNYNRPVKTTAPAPSRQLNRSLAASGSKSSSPDLSSNDRTISYSSSFTSQTELLKKTNDSVPPRSNVRSRGGPTDGMPERKQVRIRDPYAIDTDDEDDELLDLHPKPPPRRQEESLADFLRNAEPPLPPPSPVAMSSSTPKTSLKKKSSAANLLSRLRSTKTTKITKAAVSSPIEARHPPSLNGSRPEVSTSHSTATFNTTASSGRRIAPSKPLQVRTNIPPMPKNPLQNNTSTPASSSNGPRRQIFEAREAKAYTGDSDSSGLADFLRYTGPPVGIERTMSISSGAGGQGTVNGDRDDGNRFKGMAFGSGKKKRGIAV